MTKQNYPNQSNTVLDEIIDNAIELPVEGQKLILMIAKAMQDTRSCEMHENAAEQQYGAAGWNWKKVEE